jgi:hypothetical protein
MHPFSLEEPNGQNNDKSIAQVIQRRTVSQVRSMPALQQHEASFNSKDIWPAHELGAGKRLCMQNPDTTQDSSMKFAITIMQDLKL